jgi:hypothetical protein
MLYWEYLSQGVPHGAVSGHITNLYASNTEGARIERDLQALLADFQSEQLIRPSGASRALAEVTAKTTKLPPDYAAPELAKYDDVEEMMLLDPVHDVSDAGWPQPAPANRKEHLPSE